VSIGKLLIRIGFCAPARTERCAGEAGTYIAQSFASVPGQQYHLSFLYANNCAVPQSTGTVRVRGNTNLVETTLSHSGSTPAAMNYSLFSTNFTADSSSTELRFTHLTMTTAGLMLDAVQVDPSVPYIQRQPQNQVGYWGKNVTFSVTAYGWLPLTCQWRKDGTPIPGATNTSLVLTNLEIQDAGNYSVVVTNSYGSTTSSNAHLTMNPAGVSLALYPGVTIDGVVGLTYGIQYTTDLSNTNSWQGAVNVTLSVPTMLWFDMQPANQPQRYYRVVPGPISIP